MGREEDIADLVRLPCQALRSGNPEFPRVVEGMLSPNLCLFTADLVSTDS